MTFMRSYDGPPYAQGYWGGFCGPYAILNSICYLLGYNDEIGAEKLYRQIVQMINVREVILEGLDWFPLGRLAFKVQELLTEQITVKREFWNVHLPENTLDFLRLLGQHVGSGVALIGLNRPEPHWSCITKVSEDFVHFYDSTYLPEQVPINQVGNIREGKDRDYIICPHQVLMFRRVGEPGPQTVLKRYAQPWQAQDVKLKRY